MATHGDSYLVIGAGAFGASTALHLSRKYPKASITLVDRTPFPCPIGASHDINKVIRGDYADFFHTKLGLRALHVWQEDPLFKPFYHQSGMVSVFPSSSNVAGDMLENFKKSKEHYEAELINVDRCKSMFNGLYANANYEDVEDILWNPLCGWAEAAKALEATIQAAVDNGVQYQAATISKLSIDQDGRCKGAITEDGKTFEASKVILSAGSGTPKLLADSAPNRPEIRAGKRFTAAGVVSAAINLTPQQVQKYKDVPVFVLDANKTQGKLIFQSCYPWKQYTN